MHGYLIAGIIDDIMGPFRRMQWGALYPVLNRLEKEGLIRAHQETCQVEEGRTRRVYEITPAGKERLHALLMDTEHHLGDYDTIFAHKVALFSDLAPHERLYLARHYAVYAQQNIDHLERERSDLLARVRELLAAERLQDIVTLMDHRTAYWSNERAWAEQLIAQARTEMPKEAV